MRTAAGQMDADEVRDRAEWRALAARHGFDAMVADEDPGFAGRVMERVRADAARRRAVRLSFAWRAAAAAAAIAAILSTAAVFSAKSRGNGAPALAERAPATDAATAPTEMAIADWIAAQQGESGAWAELGAGEAFRPAVTALALMALADSGPSRHADAVASAVAALETMQNADGSFGLSGPHCLYNHAFASYALIDDARRNGKGVTPALEKALAFALSSQNAFAAWGYPGEDVGNDALTVWELGILAAARELGWRDSTGALRRGLSALHRRSATQTPDYRFAIGREPLPRSGGLVLTRIATKSLVPLIDAIEGRGTLAGTLLASLDAAEAASAGCATSEADVARGAGPRGNGICAAAVSLLDRRMEGQPAK